MEKYDYLVVGSGLFGAVFAHLSTKAGKKCLVIDKRPQLGGNIYCEEQHGINVHKYGAHIFHTSNRQVWDFVNALVPFNRYTNSPVAEYEGKRYNLPFNMNTFYQMWVPCGPPFSQKSPLEGRCESEKFGICREIRTFPKIRPSTPQSPAATAPLRGSLLSNHPMAQPSHRKGVPQ